MAAVPRFASLRSSLAAGLCLTSCILSGHAQAAPPARPAEAAAQLYFDGKGLQARDGLLRFLDSPAGHEPVARGRALRTLLDICIASFADDCVSVHAGAYVEALRPPDDADPRLKAELARLAGYYFDAGRLALDRPDVTAVILDWAPWKNENPDNAELYLRRQVLGARVAIAQDKPALALAFLDNALATAASLEPHGADRYVVAQSLALAIALLTELGQSSRAHGLLMATGGFIDEALPPRSVDAAFFAVVAGSLLGDLSDLAGAERRLAAATERLTAIELDPNTRDWLLGTALRLRVAMAAQRGDVAAARRLIDAHPLARQYATPGQAPETREALTYLAARALTAALEGTPDPVALAALSTPGEAETDPEMKAEAAVFRDFGRLMLTPAGPERDHALDGFSRRVRDAAVRSVRDTPGAWYRPTPVDLMLLSLALSGADTPSDGDVAFSLFQLASRFGPSFDSDALTALGAARTDPERDAVQQALRLRARRDRLERAAIQNAVARLPQSRQAGDRRYDPAARAALTEAATAIAAAEHVAQGAGAPLSGANVVDLKRFQAALAPDEAALAVTITVGGLEHICVRQGSVLRARRTTDMARLQLDARLLHAGLTATHPPSEASDAQFPVEATVRLYDDLIRPLEPCLKPGDRILWLTPVSTFALPIAALLPAAPPRLERGWDLAKAGWLVKRHTISYPGSASAVIAARNGRTAAAAADFLGVGDPVMTGQPPGARNAEIAALAPLPDTKAELEVSAKGFRRTRLLLQDEATEGRVRQALGARYRYISFATHGLIRDDLQGLSEPALVLTPVSAAPEDDGLLTATEIADLSLRARFVALSACNTANFDLAQMARELPALASAFAVAGTPATLGTLWPVNTETGRIVVGDLFTRLRASPDPAGALAEAQRAFLAAPPGRAYLHPRFWAPFVVLGDGGGR